MKKGPTNALESTFMGLGGPINCQRQDIVLFIHLIRLCIKETGRKMSTDFQDTDAQKG